ncbi:MAG TPA: carboxypeptidase-like regulatory domain-containing protein [Pirellulales bacterium]|nr:carboxypeptidase-like regulatory domain-containing protein [Pirellulales bacterium]
MRASFFRAVAIVSLGSLLTLGCSSQKGPATAKVSGVVTYKGAPVEGATVVFAPPGGGRPGTAVTDAQGHYELSTFGDKDGAIPGDYKVTVQKTKTEGSIPDLSQEEMNDRQMRGETIPGPITVNLLPEKYISPTTTDLNATVKLGTKNEIPLELKD